MAWPATGGLHSEASARRSTHSSCSSRLCSGTSIEQRGWAMLAWMPCAAACKQGVFSSPPRHHTARGACRTRHRAPAPSRRAADRRRQTAPPPARPPLRGLHMEMRHPQFVYSNLSTRTVNFNGTCAQGSATAVNPALQVHHVARDAARGLVEVPLSTCGRLRRRLLGAQAQGQVGHDVQGAGVHHRRLQRHSHHRRRHQDKWHDRLALSSHASQQVTHHSGGTLH